MCDSSSKELYEVDSCGLEMVPSQTYVCTWWLCCGKLCRFYTLCLWLTSTGIFFCTERVHLYPCGSSRCPDRKCLLGALLPGARCWAWRCLPGRSCRRKLSRRSIQHFLQYWEFWASRSKSDICRPGAHSGWWADLYMCLVLPSCVWHISVNTVHVGKTGIQATSAVVSFSPFIQWVLCGWQDVECIIQQGQNIFVQYALLFSRLLIVPFYLMAYHFM